MLYHFLYTFKDYFQGFNIFKYVTFRSILGFLLAATISIIWGRYFIKYFEKKRLGQVIRDDGPSTHLGKVGTPTMGGVFIFGSMAIALLVCGNFNSYPLIFTFFISFLFLILGLFDDYLKISNSSSKGISAKSKLFWQFSLSMSIIAILIHLGIIDTYLYIPFLKDFRMDLGFFYIPFSAFVIVGTSNAVNLTDGLDGLAIGLVIVSIIAMGTLSYVAGHKEIANYLIIPYIEGASELAVFSAITVGAGIGFLWYNAYPAQIFMGDTGSLSLGGALGSMAVITKNEILLVITGGVFVVEVISVILQVFFYKTKKKRIFKMTPIHHHFELLGWSEPKVIIRFWIISIFLALLSIVSLKIR